MAEILDATRQKIIIDNFSKKYNFTNSKTPNTSLTERYDILINNSPWKTNKSKFVIEVFETLNSMTSENIAKVLDDNPVGYMNSGFQSVEYYEDNKIILNGKLIVYPIDLLSFSNMNKDNFSSKKAMLKEMERLNSDGKSCMIIFNDEWKNKQEVIISMIKNKLGNSTFRLYARQCEVKEISYQEASKFLDIYHLQGKDRSAVRYGMFHKDELVSVITFSKGNVAKGRKNAGSLNVWELGRFCLKNDYSITGGFSKFLKHFISEKNPENLFTFSDLRYSVGSVYKTCGFEELENTQPNYWYIIKDDTGNVKKIHRFNFRRDRIVSIIGEDYGKEYGELDYMCYAGIPRVFDCGNKKFTMNLKDVKDGD